MSMLSKHNSKRGVALVGVMMFCSVIVIMVGILVFNTKSKKETHTFQYDTTQALMAANAAIQLAVYKYRVLPSEYYRIYEMEISERATGVADPNIEEAKRLWLADLTTEPAEDGSIPDGANKIKTFFDQHTVNSRHSFAVTGFDLVSSENEGYQQDYIELKPGENVTIPAKILKS